MEFDNEQLMDVVELLAKHKLQLVPCSSVDGHMAILSEDGEEEVYDIRDLDEVASYLYGFDDGFVRAQEQFEQPAPILNLTEPKNVYSEIHVFYYKSLNLLYVLGKTGSYIINRDGQEEQVDIRLEFMNSLVERADGHIIKLKYFNPKLEYYLVTDEERRINKAVFDQDDILFARDGNSSVLVNEDGLTNRFFYDVHEAVSKRIMYPDTSKLVPVSFR